MFNGRMDEMAEKELSKANERYVEKFRRPLIEGRVFPELLKFSSSEKALHVTAMQMAGGALAAPDSAPAAPASGDLQVRVHQSAVNNMTKRALRQDAGGQRSAKNSSPRNWAMPKRPPEEEDDENWGITFATGQPDRRHFRPPQVHRHDSGAGLPQRGQEIPVRDGYRSHVPDRGDRRGNQGRPRRKSRRLFRPADDAASRFREQTLRTILERRFAKTFKPEIVPKNLVLKQEGRTNTELQLTHWQSASGWLVMAWKQVPLTNPSTEPAESSKETTKDQKRS